VKQLMPIGIIILVGGLGFLVGLGSLAILAGLTAMFCLMAAFGGSLAADLRLLAWFGPVLVLAVGVPRLLGEFSQWAAVALLVVIVFLVCLVPVLGPRYVTVGMGLGMAAVFSYGLKSIGVGSVVQIFGAPALAFVVVLALRVVSGARDPSAPLRTAFADALTAGTGTAQENATRLWFADRPRRWTSGVMNGPGVFTGPATARSAIVRRWTTPPHCSSRTDCSASSFTVPTSRSGCPPARTGRSSSWSGTSAGATAGPPRSCGSGRRV
jgi:hypothetical protein